MYLCVLRRGLVFLDTDTLPATLVVCGGLALKTVYAYIISLCDPSLLFSVW